jgi:hypothetical protein
MTTTTTTTMMAPTKTTTAAPGAAKRQQAVDPSTEDIVRCSRDIINRDPFKVLSNLTEEERFRSLFGCAPAVALTVWMMLTKDECLPIGATMLHFLWSLLFLKVYKNQ